MYEYLVENLISYNQVDGNLRRTADKGLVSELYRRQMNALALKYFGIDSNGNYTNNKEEIVAYRCPYSGEIISDLSNAHLEHILPVSSSGGTVLFNCIPILDKVNLSKLDEPNLLAWWQEQDYFKYDRLERLVQYMLEAYTLAFKEPSEEELYDDILLNNDDYIEKGNLSIDLKSKASRINYSNQNITYYQLLSDMINELSKNRDVSKYSTELNNLKEQNVFGNIDEIEKVIKVVQNVFSEILNDNSKKYLSYSLKIDMNKLLSSLKTKDYENEIRQRLSFINKLVKENNKEINDYFESLQDIEECNPLYYDNPTDEQITSFINNIKVSHATKIKIFIDMLSDKKYTSYINGLPDSNNIFARKRNKIPFKGYEHIDGLDANYCWHNNSSEIIETIYVQKRELESKVNRTFEEEKNLNKLNLALKAIDDYDLANRINQKKRIRKFIDMLSDRKYTSYVNGVPDSNNIFSNYNEVCFEGYEHIDGLNTSYFWQTNSSKIIETIYVQKRELESKVNRTFEEDKKLNKLNLALKAIDDYNFVNKSNLINRIEKFIDMLSDRKYTSYVNGLPNSNNIFARNKIPFEGYEHIDGLNTSHIWQNYSSKIIETIYVQKRELESKVNRTFEEDKKLNKLNLALKAIDDYDFSNSLNQKNRIEKFIDMLSDRKYTSYVNGLPNSNNIFGRNKIPFEGYEHIEGLNTSGFWQRNLNEIIESIYVQKIELESKVNRTFEEDKKLNKLNLALKAIDDYDFVNKFNLINRIKKFIDMLSDIKYTNYVNGVPDSNNIFGNKKIPFEGYEHIDGLNTCDFWRSNSVKQIIPMLFYNKMYNEKSKVYINSDLDYSSSKYDSARNAVMEYLNYCRRRKKQPEFKSIDEYIDTLDKTKKEVKALIELRDSLISRKEQLLVENQELKKQLNTSVRRAM